MASWGLAYEYGKNAYEDMWRKQEENERLAAQRKLFDMQLKEEEQEQATKSLENARVRQYRDIAVAYGDKMGRGGTTGVKAYADAVTAAGIPTTVLDGNKVAAIDPATGKPDMSIVIDMSDSSKWTGSAIQSEFAKNINTLRAEADIYKATAERDRAFNWEKEKFSKQQEMEKYKADLSSATQRAVAGMYFSAKSSGGKSGSSGGSNGGKGASSPFNSDVENYAEEAAVKAIFGAGVEAVKGADGATVYIDTSKADRPQITPTEGQLTDLYNLKNQIAVEANNMWQANGTNAAAAARVLGSQKGNARTAGLAALDQNIASIMANAETPAPTTMWYGVDPVVKSPVRWSPTTGYTGGNYTNSSIFARGVNAYGSNAGSGNFFTDRANNFTSSLNYQF